MADYSEATALLRTELNREVARVFAPEPRNRLEVQRETSANDALGHVSAWLDLLDAWATLNGIRRADAGFALSTLAHNGFHDGIEVWGDSLDWPEADHVSHFRRNRRAAAVVTEPYCSVRQLDRLARFAAERGLRMHVPPNPRASFWVPGSTLFAVLTHPSFGDVRWLGDQLRFSGVFKR